MGPRAKGRRMENDPLMGPGNGRGVTGRWVGRQVSKCRGLIVKIKQPTVRRCPGEDRTKLTKVEMSKTANLVIE